MPASQVSSTRRLEPAQRGGHPQRAPPRCYISATHPRRGEAASLGGMRSLATTNGAPPQPNETCSNLTFEQNLTHPSRLWTPKLPTLRPGLRPEGVALRAVRLTGRDEPGRVGGWLMTSPAGMGIC